MLINKAIKAKNTPNSDASTSERIVINWVSEGILSESKHRKDIWGGVQSLFTKN